MTAYLENLCSDAVTDIVIPRIRPLLGQTGKIRRLNPQEVSAALTRDKSYKAIMQAKAASIGGHLGRVQSCLEKAMNRQGQVDDSSPSKKQRTMAAQAVEVYWTARQVAKSDVRTKALRQEESDNA